jgi:hypothetical protein
VPVPHEQSLTPADPRVATPSAPRELIARLSAEDAIGQLCQRTGLMRQLGSEDGTPMLDWVDGVPRLLANPDGLETVEREALALLERGVRHVIWSGMGGSVLTVQVLRALGFCAGALTVHPLDSTDPTALDQLVRHLADAKGLAPLDTTDTADGARWRAQLIRALFADVVMVGVAMGRTSEEPISHLEWFASLLREGELDAAEHMLVMSIPDSYLEHYAKAHGVPHLPLQLDGGHGTPGRMSAPTTRVFLLPVALDLAAREAEVGSLRALLDSAWTTYNLDGARQQPQDHPFVRLAAALAATALDGACGLFLATPPELDALRWWTEQLMEESLGKGGKGVVVFADQAISGADAAQSALLPRLRVRVLAETPAAGLDEADPEIFALAQPLLSAPSPDERLAGIAAVFLGLQLTVALFGYLWTIPFAGQPAVENYKSRARALRTEGAPLDVALRATRVGSEGHFQLLPPPMAGESAGSVPPIQQLAAALRAQPTYLDLTINGELSASAVATVEEQLRALGNDVLGIPVKMRHAPAAYHSTEQSEMDGPAGLVSVRVLARRHSPSLLGGYEATFLHAQAVGTWLAMNEQGRTCFLLLFDGTDDELGPALRGFLSALTAQLAAH